MVGEHLTVRLAVSQSPNGHRQPSRRRRLPARALLLLLFCSLPQRLQLLWQQAILGQPHLSAWQCPMVRLLGATELFGRPFRALTWNTENCLFFDKVIKNYFTRSDPCLCS